MRATVRDVARRAQVSPKTVSNVVNGTSPVSPHTRHRVELALGRLAAAEAALLEVSESFLADGRAFDAAQVALDLAVLYLRQHRPEETKQLATELLAAFQARDVHQEALAALIVLQQAAEQEHLTGELVEEVAAYLLAASGDPHLKFRG